MGLRKQSISLRKRNAGLMKNRKGVVFTLSAIAIAALFTIIFTARIEKPLDYKTEMVETRVNVLSDYMNNFFKYAETSASVSGYIALQCIIDDISTRHSPNQLFEEQFLNLTMTGNFTSSKKCTTMTNNTIVYYLDQVKAIVEQELNLKSYYNITSINMSQIVGPFSIEIIMNISLNITDTLANMSDTRIVVSSVNIEGLLDPLYLLNGTYNQTINKTTLQKPGGGLGGGAGVGGIWNYTDLQQLYNKHEYRQYYDGISFINRIKGRTAAGPSFFNIESFVNHTRADVIARMSPNSSMADFLFWHNISLNCHNESRKIINDSIINSSGGLYPPFQLDMTNINDFTISGQDFMYTC